MQELYLGIDVGSVSTNVVLMDNDNRVLEKYYLRTQGQPIQILKGALEDIASILPETAHIAGIGTTGSGRQLASVIVGADAVKNEITAHGIAALKSVPEVSTVLEIGGQDSKIIIIRNGMVSDFAMNTVCAAGTGSFLDRQANRLDIPIEEFGSLALESKCPVRIAGRCAVFAESDMIHKQQMGCSVEDIVKGLCQALVRNYLNNVAKGKEILPKVVFQGGVAANRGIIQAFEEMLNTEVVIPEHYDVMGAFGAALLAKREVKKNGITNFRGFKMLDQEFSTNSFECDGCPNLCEIIEIKIGNKTVARWGDRCGKWHYVLPSQNAVSF
ncbi:MAG: acyl-CoA dehydratase activase [Xylanivirga thermophila]|jgi:predicted CoA-substrate-specific enzyme activase|uniref:acyl-CoA dehydratase activase n=1 Tax=Xylanivirga thermophila TaxID=2496273 RepID=UPI00101BE4FE|nr:acyl-CoA dehydratase activase [Xylanivirga thermophila]